MKAYNINEHVKVKLTKKGLDIINQQEFPPNLKTDENGLTEFQMWELMMLFGSSIYLGCNSPFETTIYFNENDLT